MNNNRDSRFDLLCFTESLQLMASFDNVRSLTWSFMSTVIVKA